MKAKVLPVKPTTLPVFPTTLRYHVLQIQVQSSNGKIFIKDLDISMAEKVDVQICFDDLQPIILTTVL